MSDEPTGRGRQRRQDHRAQLERAEALSWWRSPGVLIFAAAVGLAAAGATLLLREGTRIPVREASIGGLSLDLAEARWVLDQMDHGENFQKPSTMMPDMPEAGKQRLTLDLAFENRSQQTQVYDGAEFMLVPELGEPVPPMGALVGVATLAPGQSLNTALHFDFDATDPHGRLLVEWRRGNESAFLPVPEPAEHYHLRPRGGELILPERAELLLPIGKAVRGQALFGGRYGCSACHGSPAVPGSNLVGPHLGGIAVAAESRVEGLSAPQYIYDSILRPGDFIAPDCQNNQPCTAPSAMPDYASLVSLEDVADLLAYLLDQDGSEQG